MEIYNNVSCPVCHKKFEQGDDIVTCPICGTPHHRECYNSLGHCANESLHSQGFDFESSQNSGENPQEAEEETTEKVQQKNEADGPWQPPIEESEKKSHCVNCGKEIEKGTPFCVYCGAKQPETTYGSFANGAVFVPPVSNEYKDSKETIDGESLEDVATVVGNNAQKFLKFFKKNKKASWNWSALIFGAYYFFFRKMYKAGATIMVANFAMLTALSAIFNKGYEVISSYITSSLQTGGFDLSKMSSSDLQAANSFSLAVVFFGLILNILCAVFANYIYKRKVIAVIKTTREKLKGGGQFQEMSLFGEQISLTEKDMYKMYLSRLGGVSFLAPIMAYFALSLIENLITMIL